MLKTFVKSFQIVRRNQAFVLTRYLRVVTESFYPDRSSKFLAIAEWTYKHTPSHFYILV